MYQYTCTCLCVSVYICIPVYISSRFSLCVRFGFKVCINLFQFISVFYLVYLFVTMYLFYVFASMFPKFSLHDQVCILLFPSECLQLSVCLTMHVFHVLSQVLIFCVFLSVYFGVFQYWHMFFPYFRASYYPCFSLLISFHVPLYIYIFLYISTLMYVAVHQIQR